MSTEEYIRWLKISGPRPESAILSMARYMNVDLKDVPIQWVTSVLDGGRWGMYEYTWKCGPADTKADNAESKG